MTMKDLRLGHNTRNMRNCVELALLQPAKTSEMILAGFFGAPPSQKRKTLLDPALNWEDLIEEAAMSYVLPWLALQANDLSIECSLPTDIAALFAATESFSAERNQMIIAEAVHAARLLNEVDIQPAALKGLAYLLTGVYRNPAGRHLLDIDLLVKESQIPYAVAHLKQNGYFECGGDHFAEFRHHHQAIRREGLPAIEIHHRVGIGICAKLLPTDKILASAHSLTCGGAKFLVPSPTDLVNHLILHSQLAHPYFERIFPPLRCLVDLVELQQHYGNRIDWASVVQTYEDAGEAATLSLHLRHANYVLRSQFPVTSASIINKLRWERRLMLNKHPKLRLIDPWYLLWSLFSRRLRLAPQILRKPSSWLRVIRGIARSDFVRNLKIP